MHDKSRTFLILLYITNYFGQLVKAFSWSALFSINRKLACYTNFRSDHYMNQQIMTSPASHCAQSSTVFHSDIDR